MKAIMRLAFFIALTATMVSSTYAQTKTTTTKKTTTTTKSKSTAKKPAPVVYGKEIPVTLKSLAEGTVAIFAGPKEELKEITRRKTIGGLSTNKLYLRVNEVVCILNNGKTVSCAVVKSTTTTLEINISGNEIVAK